MTETYPLDPKQIRREVSSAIHSLDRLRGSVAYELVGAVVNAGALRNPYPRRASRHCRPHIAVAP